MYKNIVVLFLSLLISNAIAANPLRSIEVNNQCPFDVSLKSVGSNASVMACTASATSAQSNCPSGYVCYAKNATTNYCVAGTQASGATLPLSKMTDITLNATNCPSGQQVSDTGSAQWGQCSCSGDSGCANSQSCQSATSSIKQCYWSLPLANNGKLSKKSGSSNTLTVPLNANSTASSAIVASGKFYAKLACDDNGNCSSDNTKGAPATLVEFTLQNDNDWYDVSYINGVNLPATMQPKKSTDLDYQKDDPYRCMAAGADADTMNAIFKFQKDNKIKGNQELAPFACSNDFATTFTKNKQPGFNFVSSSKKAPTCSATKACGGGAVCGLTLEAVQSGSTQTTCGQRLGYWTYAQFCSANKKYNNSDLGIKCDTAKDYSYALCIDQKGVKDKGPGRSCFNSNTTSKGDTCCGFEDWQIKQGKKTLTQPMGKGDSAVSGALTSYWKTNILPVVEPIKQNCHLAYAFQFDDPYSTFTCATQGAGQNTTSYEITLCPGGNAAGINPPAAPSCKAKVPSAYSSDQFTAAAPSGITVTVTPCDKSGKCNNTSISPKPKKSAIYSTASGKSNLFEITATKGATTQSCKFNIQDGQCISRDPSNNADCKTWVIAPDGAWQGRSIGIPDF